MTTQSIHGNLLEVTVVSCNRLEDMEWISRQDPKVYVEYGGNRSCTRTYTDGGKNPTFQEKFVYTLIEGLRELNVEVWNSNILTQDNFIGSGKVQLAKAISQGFDDSTWPLQSKSNRYSGEVRIILQYSCVNIPANNYAQSAQPFGAPHASHYSTPPPRPPPPPPSAASYPPVGVGYPDSGANPYPPQAYPYCVQPYPAAYVPPAGGYPAPSPYPPQAYPYCVQPYPAAYAPPAEGYPVPSPYPPQASPYPPNSAYPPQPYESDYLPDFNF